jgi:hypothetical protein
MYNYQKVLLKRSFSFVHTCFFNGIQLFYIRHFSKKASNWKVVVPSPFSINLVWRAPKVDCVFLLTIFLELSVTKLSEGDLRQGREEHKP